jgi:endonuclease/exonuclease/phosphatase family metal-dependent hydrolase
MTIMTYNLLNYPDHDNQYVRTDNFATIFNAIESDILVVTEMKSQDGVDRLLEFGLNHISRDYTAGPFFNGYDTDNAVYYRTDRVTLENTIRIITSLRDINGYTFSINDHQDPSFRFTVFSAHLKASNTTADANRRYQETLKLAQYIANQDSNYFYAFAGDFNFYGAGEPGYKLLLDSLAVDLEDPLDARGEWYNDSSYTYLHTQSTRTTQLPDGGASGGLDDRFDFILLSHHMLRDSGPLTYVTGTYNAYGNDGKHFNGDINSGNNGVVSATIADALYYASDHLPVMLELSYPTTLAVADRAAWPVAYALHQNYPNPFNPGTTIRFDLPVASDTRITVYDLLGREVVRLADGRLEPGYHQLLWNGLDTRGRAVPTGMYIVLMMTPEFGKNIKVLLLK